MRDRQIEWLCVWELIRFEVRGALFGYRAIAGDLGCVRDVRAAGVEARVERAFANVVAFYPRTVLCLQSSVATARVLRRLGVAAEVIIGFRPSPFLGHAWVEVGGRVVNDSSGIPRMMLVLDRLS
ncbi:MAG TPA: lasso peptide biosynthesis B2 protein [Bryobacteraceae bacterium]|jgi:hypothetical protein